MYSLSTYIYACVFIYIRMSVVHIPLRVASDFHVTKSNGQLSSFIFPDLQEH